DVTNDTAREKKDNSARYSRKSIITLDENGKAREEVIEEFEGDERLRPLLNDLAPLPDAPSLTPPPFPGPSLADTIPPAPFDLRMDEFSRIFGEEFGEDLAEMLTRKEADVAALMRAFEEKFRSEEWVRQFEFNFPQRTFDSLE